MILSFVCKKFTRNWFLYSNLQQGQVKTNLTMIFKKIISLQYFKRSRMFLSLKKKEFYRNMWEKKTTSASLVPDLSKYISLIYFVNYDEHLCSEEQWSRMRSKAGLPNKGSSKKVTMAAPIFHIQSMLFSWMVIVNAPDAAFIGFKHHLKRTFWHCKQLSISVSHLVQIQFTTDLFTCSQRQAHSFNIHLVVSDPSSVIVRAGFCFCHMLNRWIFR